MRQSFFVSVFLKDKKKYVIYINNKLKAELLKMVCYL